MAREIKLGILSGFGGVSLTKGLIQHVLVKSGHEDSQPRPALWGCSSPQAGGEPHRQNFVFFFSSTVTEESSRELMASQTGNLDKRRDLRNLSEVMVELRSFGAVQTQLTCPDPKYPCGSEAGG